MRQSNQTGQQIYNSIKELEKEVQTVKEAMSNVAFNIGEDTVAYRLLKDNMLKKAETELNNLLETKFTIVGR